MNDTEKDIDYQNKPRHNGKVLVGMVLLAVGGILLLEQFTFLDIPGWIWSWPTWIIIWGLYSGARHNYHNSTWVILLAIGFAGVLNEAIPGLHLGNLIWPGAIILVGVWIIMKRNHTLDKGKWDRKWDKNKWEMEWKQKWDAKYHTSAQPQEGQPAEGSDANTPPPPNIGADDFLDAVSVFGGVKKTVLSKNFRGGDITNIFGGAEIDLTMADIDGKVILDITQVFGGTKIIVPSHWQVVSNLSAVFAGVDDKRLRKTGSGDSNKVLVLEGVSIFAGVDIRSF